MTFEHARAVADAVLFEGYALYPYRRSAIKNQQRWPFGVLAPRAFEDAGGSEPSWMQSECLVAPVAASGTLRASVRFLRLRRRRVYAPADGEAPREVGALEVDGAPIVGWDEGEVHEIDLAVALDGASSAARFELGGDVAEELVRAASGEIGARVTRERRAITGTIRVDIAPVAAERACSAVRVRVENTTPWEGDPAARHDELGVFMAGTHVLLGVEGGEFLSLLDPPPWAEAAVAACRNVRSFPVLAGARGARDVVLCSPIILYDDPQIAPESPGDFYDATEIDELLTLRTRTMTDEEKREARALDDRVARLVDRAEALPEAIMARLHGAIRELLVRDAPFAPPPPKPPPLAPGARVTLHPGARRSDAHDMFLDGKTATVRRVLRDAEDRSYVAVTIDDDPAAELHLAKRRYHYFYEDEVEPVARP